VKVPSNTSAKSEKKLTLKRVRGGVAVRSSVKAGHFTVKL
jgi:hypothetical protein